jgi:hypothetical protein
VIRGARARKWAARFEHTGWRIAAEIAGGIALAVAISGMAVIR